MNMQKDVLYNFLPVGGGGGLQNALSFVSNIETAEGRHFLIRQGSPVCAVAKQKGALVHEVSSVKGRLACEWNAGKRFADFQGVFAIFGASFIHSHRYFINIGGFAVSALFPGRIFKLALIQLVNRLNQCYSKKFGQRRTREGKNVSSKIFFLVASGFCAISKKGEAHFGTSPQKRSGDSYRLLRTSFS